ncbi:MAG: hypothetical protein Q8936_16530 [Bacillota bacterium]|nr:hypothetical protein [Bacillota bacterium]
MKIKKEPYWVIIFTYIFITVLFFITYGEVNYDKINYKLYKTYEISINEDQDSILADADKYVFEYYNGISSKRETVRKLGKVEKKLNKVYNSFKWNRGDVGTKEIYSIKKQIMLEYIGMYKNISDALRYGIKYSDLEDLQNIKSLKQKYIEKDIFEREKFNINFNKK